MPTKRITRSLLLVGALLLALFIGVPLAYFMNGGWDYAIDLPGGYLLVRSWSDNVALCDSARLELVAPHVERYTVVKYLVVGHVVKIDRDPQDEDRPGYFILDTRTARVWKGLKEKQWLALLRKYGVNEKPHMRRPTRPLFER